MSRRKEPAIPAELLDRLLAGGDAGAHAVLLMDQAGWHVTPRLKVPDNTSIVAIPSKSPELNPQENIWQFMRDNWLSNTVFETYEEILDHCCEAWPGRA